MTNTSSSTLNKPVLREGSKGEAVKELQELLLRSNIDVVVDGIFGPQTTGAVKFFQCKMFLLQDGIVGDKTWRTLYQRAPVDMPVIRKGDTGELVRKIQQRLSDGGYYRSNIDGDFGPITESAVKDLQIKAGLSIDGIVGNRTWHELSKIDPSPSSC
ncbi:MAG: peptidoglycan-binding protein [Mastigocoleus sp. MO_167.B18]|uniref:peptidoglycan-binding domain-containing protein n=1 Tax=Mastigocoleus sp. MO_188.B34 TaxID=3036635 RepID=UPI0026301664|nr:peptidoglycan-binding protein [Mastigocoleus sp. MO_188.B34]MDJ0695604.1 peptidoglycan-binding protein [Mastigocoleus sp. MO_188.B34]MDJ0772208.1 peptidoglycan-binding protein [Mastigocoleus sp. MO_167.B18]